MSDATGLKASTVPAHYLRLLGGTQPSPALLESVESGTLASDLSPAGVKDRVDLVRSALYEVIDNHLGGDAALRPVADQIAMNGARGLELLGQDPERLEEEPEALSGLEAIVRVDGSRPSFMIREGVVDETTSPIGNWGDTLGASENALRDAIACVGRIDVPDLPGGFVGTGFLIHPNLILTNRHVLQVSATKENDGSWKFRDGACIDFGHEFKARDSVNPRRLKRLVYCGPKVIDGSKLDHGKLDLALIELEPAEQKNLPIRLLSVGLGTDWVKPDKTKIYTIGYPAPPPPDAGSATLLEQLFKSTYGCKRLAPGMLLPFDAPGQPWTVAHDATTLGGNSGSIVLTVGEEGTAAGLHYGGRWSEPRMNWAHVLGLALNTPAGNPPETLQAIFARYEVETV